MIGAREIERGTRELARNSLAFDRRGNFRVMEHEAVGEAAIGEERAKPVYKGFEAMGFFVVGDNDGVEV